MGTGLLLAYEALSSLVPFAAVLFWWMHRQTKRGRAPAGWTGILALVLAVYAAGICYFTGAGTIYDLFTYGGEIRPEQINLVPFSRRIDGAAYGLNLILFLPFGFLVPWFCSRMASWPRVLAGGFGLSLLVEITQLLNIRSTDVDDLILNTLGALIGWVLYRVLRHRLLHFRQDLPPVLLWLSLLVPFAGRFLLFYEIGLARLLYGF